MNKTLIQPYAIYLTPLEYMDTNNELTAKCYRYWPSDFNSTSRFVALYEESSLISQIRLNCRMKNSLRLSRIFLVYERFYQSLYASLYFCFWSSNYRLINSCKQFFHNPLSVYDVRCPAIDDMMDRGLKEWNLRKRRRLRQRQRKLQNTMILSD